MIEERNPIEKATDWLNAARRNTETLMPERPAQEAAKALYWTADCRCRDPIEADQACELLSMGLTLFCERVDNYAERTRRVKQISECLTDEDIEYYRDWRSRTGNVKRVNRIQGCYP